MDKKSATLNPSHEDILHESKPNISLEIKLCECKQGPATQHMFVKMEPAMGSAEYDVNDLSFFY